MRIHFLRRQGGRKGIPLEAGWGKLGLFVILVVLAWNQPLVERAVIVCVYMYSTFLIDTHQRVGPSSDERSDAEGPWACYLASSDAPKGLSNFDASTPGESEAECLI